MRSKSGSIERADLRLGPGSPRRNVVVAGDADYSSPPPIAKSISVTAGTTEMMRARGRRPILNLPRGRRGHEQGKCDQRHAADFTVGLASGAVTAS
jgi:hypothetical protein